jgi:hypothetical protein
MKMVTMLLIMFGVHIIVQTATASDAAQKFLTAYGKRRLSGENETFAQQLGPTVANIKALMESGRDGHLGQMQHDFNNLTCWLNGITGKLEEMQDANMRITIALSESWKRNPIPPSVPSDDLSSTHCLLIGGSCMAMCTALGVAYYYFHMQQSVQD